MEGRHYRLILSVKSPLGFDSYGRFHLGREFTYAKNIFDNMKGTSGLTEHTIYHFSFLAMDGDDIAAGYGNISCTIEEVMENVKLISELTFELLNK